MPHQKPGIQDRIVDRTLVAVIAALFWEGYATERVHRGVPGGGESLAFPMLMLARNDHESD